MVREPVYRCPTCSYEAPRPWWYERPESKLYYCPTCMGTERGFIEMQRAGERTVMVDHWLEDRP